MTKNFWNKKKVLITGHTGFKGGWLCFILKILGANVYGVSLKPEKKSLFNNLKIFNYNQNFYCDITDFKKINNISKKINPQIIFHFAAQSLVGKSYSHFDETYKTNIIGTLNVLKMIKENKNIKTCLITTTDKVYENLKKKKKMYLEHESLKGSNPYSGSKVAKEHLIFSFAKSFLNKKNIVIVRSGNVIGGGDWNSSRLIPDMINSFQKNKKFLVRNFNHTRPWQHIFDVINSYALIASKKYTLQKFNFEIWNIGPLTKKNYSVKNIIKMIEKKISKKIVIKLIKSKNVEKKFLNLNSTKLFKKLNIKNKLNTAESIDLTFDWYLKSFKTKKDNFSENQLIKYLDYR